MGWNRSSSAARRLTSALGLALVSLVAGSGCVTVAEFRKLERKVIDMERGGIGAGGNVADVQAELDALRTEVDLLRGQLEVVDQTAANAMLDARKARQDLATRSAAEPDIELSEEPAAASSEPLSEEVRAYREAYAAWRADDTDACIDQFRAFLQSHPESTYADDAAYWMADCHFKEGDYKNAVLRFDDVVRSWPEREKAPDALYRQGESLLKLGPGFHEAAKRAFERVVKEYPESAAAEEARRRLDLVAG